MKRTEQYSDQIARLYPSKKVKTDDGQRILTQSITFQVTDDCNLACLYCYQGHKGKNRMSFETAKKFFDLVVSGEKGFKSYINPEKSPGLVVDFIGGEPFLEIELIDQICTYIMDKLIELDHPWAMKTMFSICSNGVLYRDEKVQAFLRKWANRLSFSVTIDGNKELHDSCRVFPDGGPSYDIAVDAASDWMKRGNHMGSKITIAPGNISFLYDTMNKDKAIDALIACAENEVGYLEKKSNSQLDDKTANAGYNNYTKYWRDVYPQYQAQAWCAAFVSWCMMKTFGLDVAKKLLKHWPYVYCPTLGNLFTKYANPQRGDIVIFYRNGTFAHTGLVTKVEGDKFYTIEGNTSGGSSIVPNGGGVYAKSYYNSNLPGTKFCRPDYSIVTSILKLLILNSLNIIIMTSPLISEMI